MRDLQKYLYLSFSKVAYKNNLREIPRFIALKKNENDIMTMKKYGVLLLLVVAAFFVTVPYAQEKKYNWLNITGKWEIRSDNRRFSLLESLRTTRKYDNSELVNYNSIITEDPIPEFSSIQFSFEMGGTPGTPSEMVVFFSAQDFRTYYGLKLKADGTKDATLVFHGSSVRDTTLRPHIKGNFVITDFATKDVPLEYNREYRAEVRVKKNRAALYLDGKKMLEAEAPEEMTGGKIGFSNRNAALRIAGLKVYDGRTLVFEDDFSKDSIKRYRVQATTMSKEEYEKRNKGK